MRAAGKVKNYKEKGAAGEAAAFDIVHSYRTHRGGILKQGFCYPYASDRTHKVYMGNIYWDETRQTYYHVTKQLTDEIDILYVSNFRIFAIEVKAYHDDSIVVDDEWMYRRRKRVDKSPYAQAEKHARHLYHQLYQVLPNGSPDYIVPLVCFVDGSTIVDNRSPRFSSYIPTVLLDTLKSTIKKLDVQLGEYTLDLDAIERRLREIERPRDECLKE